MNSYIYLVKNIKNNKFYIGVRNCECIPSEDKYKCENTALVKEFKTYGKKSFEKSILAIIPNEDLKDTLLEIYSKAYKCELLEELEDVSIVTKSKNKGSNNAFARKVICLNTEEVFDTAKEAGEAYGVCSSGISQACNPNIDRKYAGKDKEGNYCEWMYYDEYLAKTTGEKIDVRIRNGSKSTNKKPVKCITTGEEFESMTEGAKAYGLNTGSIHNSCNLDYLVGTHPETGEKLEWKYIKEDDSDE